MRCLLLIPLCAALVSAPAFAGEDDGGEEAPPPPRASKLVPALRKAPKVDGALKDLKGGVTVAPPDSKVWTAKVGYRRDTLYVGVEAQDDQVMNGDLLELSLFFPGAGTTATGHTWRFAIDGLRPSDPGTLPDFAVRLTDAKVVKTEQGLTLEAAIPARALPRFPAKDPLVFELCLSFEDRDQPAQAPAVTRNCTGGTMSGEALRLPEDFRRALGIKPIDRVQGLEGREHGWVGYHVLHYPAWVSADGPLNAQTLRSLVASESYDAKAAGINLPDALLLPDGRTILSVLSGKNPYEVQGRCNSDHELRVGLYLVKGQTAERVLEWPAATCALGRAVAFELDEEGELTMGYTNGATVTFIWSKDHFERTEVGSR